MRMLKQIPTGTRFGRLVTVSQVYSRTSPMAGKAQGYVKCRCDCGSPVVEIIAYELRKEKNPVRACRDCATIIQIPEGTVFGRLTTMSEVYIDWSRPPGSDRTRVRVVCECQPKQQFPVSAARLRKGGVRSCGCLKIDTLSTAGGLSTKHPRLYGVWGNMINRCQNPSTDRYLRYGGKGITVCAEWHQARVFVDWALAHGYEPDLTLDRIDPDGNYEPANCRWILSAENTRRAGRLLDGPNADDIEARLTAYAQQTGKSRNFIIGEALSAYLRKVQP
ncbi:MAG TPA: hypothetical protein VF070_12280 [Streptosporangiaceae bacterium]